MRLKISGNRHFLCDAQGNPFFYLGDTAWELFHRLTLDEAERYLSDRAEKGFTVIQAVVIAEIGGVTDPNALGDLPFEEQDADRPVEAYFRHVDDIVSAAQARGLYIGMLPTWGDYWQGRGRGPKLFTPDKARRFGGFLGRRYAGKPLIWILGGDRTPHTEEDYAIVRAMAEGLREGDGGEHLITFHPTGPGRSAQYFHGEPWLDFNMNQTSHGARDHFNGAYIQADWDLKPPKPTLDGEPRYEQIPVGFYNQGMNFMDKFDDFDARQAAYFALFSGACGHTYGNNNIWQMYAPGRKPVLWADTPWYEALNHPGARQMGHLRRLMEDCDFTNLVSAQDKLIDAPGSGGGRVLARMHPNGSVMIVYTPYGMPFGLDMRFMREDDYIQVWMNPKYGSRSKYHGVDTGAFQTFTPPSSGRGMDWVLILRRTSEA